MSYALARTGEPGRVHTRVIDGNMAGTTPRELAQEFSFFRKLRPKLSRAVLHVSLSIPTTDRELTDDEWGAIARRFLDEFGFRDSGGEAPFIVAKHDDSETHRHIHIICSRITAAGKTISDSRDFERAETILRGIEKDYDLTPVLTGRASTPQLQQQRRTKMKEETKQAIAQRLDGAADAAEAERHREQGVLMTGGECANELSERDRREMCREALSASYDQLLRKIFGDEIRHVHQIKRGVVIYTTDGGRIHDEGDRVAIYKTDVNVAAKRLIAVAAAKGWVKMRIWGGSDFLLAAMLEARSNGIEIVPADEAQAELLESIMGERGGGDGVGYRPRTSSGPSNRSRPRDEPVPPDADPIPPEEPTTLGKLTQNRLDDWLSATRESRKEEAPRPRKSGGFAP